MKKYKVDLHTHSILSQDGGLSLIDYKNILNNGTLDAVAVTDHNAISFAKKLKAELGDRIIVGEEIKTKDGEIIGLFLKEEIAKGLSTRETIKEIKKQNGIVYVPHPFETIRKGLQKNILDQIYSDIDILEVFNSRSFFRNKNFEAKKFASVHNLLTAASSDAHGIKGIGSSYVEFDKFPCNKNTLISGLKNAAIIEKSSPFYAFLSPAMNRLKKIFL